MAVRAVIYVPERLRADICRWRRECHAHVRRRRWELAAITSSPRAVAQLLLEGRADRVVVARPEHRRDLLADLLAAVDVVTDHPARVRGDRRTHRLYR